MTIGVAEFFGNSLYIYIVILKQKYMSDDCVKNLKWLVDSIEYCARIGRISLPSYCSKGDINQDYLNAKVNEGLLIDAFNLLFGPFGWRFISIKDYAKQVGDRWDNKYDCQNGDIVVVSPTNEILKFDLKQADATQIAIDQGWLCTITDSSYKHFCEDPVNKFYIVANHNASKIKIISASMFKRFLNTDVLKENPSKHGYGKFVKGIDIEKLINTIRSK